MHVLRSYDRKRAVRHIATALFFALATSFCALCLSGDYIEFDRMARNAQKNWERAIAEPETEEALALRLEELQLELGIDYDVEEFEGVAADNDPSIIDAIPENIGEKLGSVSADVERSKIELPEEQERDIKRRQEEIARLFSALEIRREMRRLEEEARYKAEKEAELLEKRREHVSTANFGHTYDREFHYRGEYRRYDRLSSGMGIGEYYGDVWKHVSVETVLNKAMVGRYPSRARRMNALYGVETPSQTIMREWSARNVHYGPGGIPIYIHR